jgi:hypothetical protein
LTETNGIWSGIDSCLGWQFTVTSLQGTAPNDVWLVGSGFLGRIGLDPSQAYIYHFDGNSWTAPYTDAKIELIAVAPLSNTDVIVVGMHGRIVRKVGTNWVDQTSGTTNDLLGVWGDPNGVNAFAVGSSGTVIRYDGATWQPQTSGTTASLRGVWGSSGSNVFAVGDGGTIVHFNGTGWTAQPSGTTQNLKSVWGNSPNSVFAVGDGGTVLRYDGSAWNVVATGFQMNFSGVWGSSGSDVFVSGRSISQPLPPGA